ncbi:MAG: NAD-dependent dehydratase [Candidatus Marinimicrobia bacterium]|nr:NAD-dependent dehydratase [Candidatus Neomarinimicrobiota bacterium]
MNNVVFGTGPLAWWVMHYLLERGEKITLASRSGKTTRNLPHSVEVKQCDARNEDEVGTVCKDAETIYFCAMPPYTNWPELFPPLVTGFLRGAAKTKARLVFGDNLYMYGPTGGASINESLPHSATGHKGRTRATMARFFMQAHERGDNQVTIGRASDFFGPEVINAVFGDMFFKPVYEGKSVNLLGNINLNHTFCYIKDFARGLITLGNHDQAYGEVWHVPSAAAVSTAEMVKLIENEMSRTIKVRTAGKGLISLLGLFNPMIKEVKEMMYTWQEPYVVDHSKFEKAFGLNITEHQDAIRETVAWYNKRYLTQHE